MVIIDIKKVLLCGDHQQPAKDNDALITVSKNHFYAPCDRKIATLNAVTQNGLALQDAPVPIDREIALAAVTQNGLALAHVSEEMKNDPDIVLTAVMQNGLALEHAADNLKDDPDIVLAAIMQNGLALEHASDRLKDNPATVLHAIARDGNALQFASAKERSDRNNIIVANNVLRLTGRR